MKDKDTMFRKLAKEIALHKSQNDLLKEQLRICEQRNKILHKYINNYIDQTKEKEKKNDRYN
jgi:hypothetical protein|tara:strand:+ start:1227 stop:1412 length:186 start_codon:yes stop_codon:yes gene_type:complete